MRASFFSVVGCFVALAALGCGGEQRMDQGGSPLSDEVAAAAVAQPGYEPREQAPGPAGRALRYTGPAALDAGGCVRSGCMNELCVDAAQGQVTSPCTYRPEYACLHLASCGRNPSSQECQWSPTLAQLQCLADLYEGTVQ